MFECAWEWARTVTITMMITIAVIATATTRLTERGEVSWAPAFISPSFLTVDTG